jgi:protein TonB
LFEKKSQRIRCLKSAFRVFTPPPLTALSSTESKYNYAARQRSPLKHWRSIALVVLLHVILLWAIQSGLATKVVQVAKVVVQAELISEVTPSLPPPPAPKPPEPAPKTPPPAPTAPVVTTPSPAAIQLPAAPPVAAPVAPAAPPAPAAPAVRTSAVIQAGATCAKPDYPSASRRLEEEGTVTLKFLIGVDGRVMQAEVEKTSGFQRLDEAARNALSKCQFKPGTVDGKPEQSWASIKYTWRLE